MPDLADLAELRTLLEETGRRRYGMERVDQRQHALQAAALAERDGAAPALVLASLLHDIGHLIDARAEGAAARGIDRQHERIGAGYLERWFGPDVCQPVRLHVAAKRYLCAIEPGYFDALSAASVRSLTVQGGPFSADEAAAFIAQPYAADGIAVRRWDDEAKDPAATPPPLDHFWPLVEQVRRA